MALNHGGITDRTAGGMLSGQEFAGRLPAPECGQTSRPNALVNISFGLAAYQPV